MHKNVAICYLFAKDYDSAQDIAIEALDIDEEGETTARDTLLVIKKVAAYTNDEGLSHDDAVQRAERELKEQQQQ